MVVACVLVFAAAPRTAGADAGRPSGWHADRATEEIVVGRLLLKYEPQLHEDAVYLATRAPGWWSEIETESAGDVDDPATVYFLGNAGRVATATEMPRWVAGVAHPPRGDIMIARHGPDGAPTDLQTLLRHEMAHVILYRAAGERPLPRWFHEGMAESFTEGISLNRAETLAGAVFGPGIPNLRDLEGAFHSDDGRDASIAYAAARDLVTHLRYHDGSGAQLRQVLTELRLGHGFEASFVRAYDMTLEELVHEWRTGLPGRFIWYAMLAGGGMPFALVLPLVAWAWMRRRRVLRLSWERIEAEDTLVSAGWASGAQVS